MKRPLPCAVVAAISALIYLLGNAAPSAAAKPEAPAAEEKRELLSEHKTVAQLKGIAFQKCRGRTALCPDNCGHSGQFATFTIVRYLDYQKPGQYGDPKAESFTVQVEDNHNKPKLPAETAKAVLALKPGDYVLLDWKHEYVTRFEPGGRSSSSPQRPLTKVQKITKEDADKAEKAG